jgi:hypothetical protein
LVRLKLLTRQHEREQSTYWMSAANGLLMKLGCERHDRSLRILRLDVILLANDAFDADAVLRHRRRATAVQPAADGCVRASTGERIASIRSAPNH